MRRHISIIISVLISFLFIFHTATAERVCTDVVEDGEEFELCFDVPDEPEDPPEEPPDEPPEPPEPPDEPGEPPGPEIGPEPLPEGMIAEAARINDRTIIMGVTTPDQEKANFILELIDEKIGDDIIQKPRLNVNLDIKNLVKMPSRVDVKLIPYTIYTILTLSAAFLLLILWIIKDIVTPKWKL